MSMSSIVAVISLLLSLTGCACFNVDTDYPIIFADPTRGRNSLNRTSYFGYSVAFHKIDNDPQPWVLIGSPRAKSAYSFDSVEPGALYKCKYQTQQCEELDLDKQDNNERASYREQYTNGRVYAYEYVNGKDRGWLGVSLDVQRGDIDNKVVVCGHRWQNKMRDDESQMNGVCYLIPNNLDIHAAYKRIPMLRPENQRFTQGTKAFPFYRLGQAGMSSCFVENYNEVVLGAPSTLTWKGTAIRMEYGAETFPFIPHPYKFDNNDIPYFSLFGYSIASGKFYRDGIIYHVAGAPKSDHFYGGAYVFRFPTSERVSILVRQNLGGSQVGEHFGSSLAVTDINNDGFDDLFVGAPNYESNSGRSGRVHVYISNGDNLSKQPFFLRGPKYFDSRFGITLAGIGDIDGDGFNDLAVGAPYHDTGSVFIYHGYVRGVSTRPAQILKAKDFSKTTRGFGISVARTMDVDDNGNPDLAIGAHLSGDVVILRTYLVASIAPSVYLPEKSLILGSRQSYQPFNMSYCFTNMNRKKGSVVNLKSLLELDADRSNPRLVFTGRESSSTSLTLQLRTRQCRTSQIKINKQAFGSLLENAHEIPIQVRISFELVENKGNSFCPTCSALNPLYPSEKTYTYEFQIDCGTDDICQCDLVADLRLSTVQYKDGSHVIRVGQDTKLTLEILGENRGIEAAANATLLISVPPYVHVVRTGSFCTDVHVADNMATTVLCQMGRPMDAGDKFNSTIELDMSAIREGRQRLTITATTDTISQDVQPSNDVKEITMYTINQADLALQGHALVEKIRYTRKGEKDKEEKHTLEHNYVVYKYGMGLVDTVHLHIKVPYTYKQQIVNIREPKFSEAATEVTCSIINGEFQLEATELDIGITGGGVNDLNITDSSEEKEDEDETRRKRTVDIYEPESEPETTSPEIETETSNLVLDCNNIGHIVGLECATIDCYIGPLHEKNSFIEALVSFDVNMNPLDDLFNVASSLTITTSASVAAVEPPGIVQPSDQRSDTASTSTVFETVISVATQSTPLWVIIVPIVCGLLLLAITILVLWKLKFFRRKKLEELNEKKRNTILLQSDELNATAQEITETD